MMGISTRFARSPLAGYITAIRESPKALLCNRRLLVSAALYATSAIPLCA